MQTQKLGELSKWHCSFCGKWNPMERGICTCGNAQAAVADCFRMTDKLTPEEELFYNSTMPSLLGELRRIRIALEEIKEYGVRHETI